jgi:hypothetical protein
MAGYSGTPLPAKLGIKEGHRVALLNAPPGVIVDLPVHVDVTKRAGGSADVIVTFITRRADLERRIVALGKMVFPAGGLWIAWPKRSSGLPTDITDQVIGEVALPSGLVDNNVCAIDDTWSGLRVVWRRQLRG